MILFLLALTALSAAAACVAVLTARAKAKRLLDAEAALRMVRERVERLNKVVDKYQKIEEAANAQRTELAQTPDTALAGRANDLFGR